MTKEMEHEMSGMAKNSRRMMGGMMERYPQNPMTVNQRRAMRHSDQLGAGAKKRKKLRGKEKVGVVMGEFKRGTLHSGSGAKVKNRKQAIAIAMNESGQSKR